MFKKELIDSYRWQKWLKTSLPLLLLLIISCNRNSAESVHARKDNANAIAPSTDSITGNLGDQNTIKFDAEKITDFMIKYPELVDVKNEVDSFYHNRQYAFVWFDRKGMIEQAENLYAHILNISSEGVERASPYNMEFAAMMDSDHSIGANVDTEIMLTAQYFLYSKKVWSGLSEKQTTRINWYLPRKKISTTLFLDSLIDGKDVLNSPPIYRQYTLLKAQLLKYHEIKEEGGFPVIIKTKENISKGDSSATVPLVREWLFIAGDLSSSTSLSVIDDSLVIGIKKFQQRTGLNVDGIIGSAVAKEMNVPIEERMQQIIVNMERSRWVPTVQSADYLLVNIPEFKLHAYTNDSLLWSMDAILGEPLHETIIFSGKIQYVVFSPYWNVPTSILKDEMLPAISRDDNYLAKHHLEWHDGRVRQRSGPDNALGLVKFLLPNSYSIYLHDTPAKYLFGESSRAFSHGCIRLSDAEKLANYLLESDSAWTPQMISKAMHLGKEKYVSLKKTEMVYIVYFTAWVDSKGQLNFRKDLYERDKRLADILLEN